MFSGIRLQGKVDISAKEFLTKVQCAIDNNTLVIGSTSGSIDFVDAATLQKVLTLSDGHRRNVTDIQPFFNQKDCYVSSSVDGFAYVWDCRERNSKPVQTFKLSNKRDNDAFSVSVNNDGTTVAAGLASEVLLFDTRTAKKALTLFCHTDTVQCVRFHPKEKDTLLTGAEDGLINIYNTSTFKDGIDTSADEEALEEEVNVPTHVVNTSQGVRTFELVGQNLEGLCTFTLGESVQLHVAATGTKVFDTDSVREHPTLAYEESSGYNVAPLYSKDTGRLYVLGGSITGALRVFHVNADGADAGVSLEVPVGQTGHTDVVRSAVRVEDRIYTVGEDGALCLWQPKRDDQEIDITIGGVEGEEEEEDMDDEGMQSKTTRKTKTHRPY